jgi:hypothetical protein
VVDFPQGKGDMLGLEVSEPLGLCAQGKAELVAVESHRSLNVFNQKAEIGDWGHSEGHGKTFEIMTDSR